MKEPKKNIYTKKFSAEGRADVHRAKKHLESAKRDFMAIGAYGRAKDILYLMVSMSVYKDYILCVISPPQRKTWGLRESPCRNLLIMLLLLCRLDFLMNSGFFKSEIKHPLNLRNSKNNNPLILLLYLQQCCSIHVDYSQ